MLRYLSVFFIFLISSPDSYPSQVIIMSYLDYKLIKEKFTATYNMTLVTITNKGVFFLEDFDVEWHKKNN